MVVAARSAATAFFVSSITCGAKNWSTGTATDGREIETP